MIKIDDTFSIERDPYQWILHEKKDGVNPKTKEPTVVTKKTYHPTLLKCCVFMADKVAGDCTSVSEITNAFKELEATLERVLKEDK